MPWAGEARRFSSSFAPVVHLTGMDDATPIVDASGKPPRRFRRARIAVSVFFGLLAVVLVVPESGNMGGDPTVRFVNRAFGVSILSMPLLILAYTIYNAAIGRWQFSLRTLLIATTLFAVVLGLVGYAVR